MSIGGLPGYAVILTEEGAGIYGSNYPNFNQNISKSETLRQAAFQQAINEMIEACKTQETIAQDMVKAYGFKDFKTLIKNLKGTNTNTIESKRSVEEDIKISRKNPNYKRSVQKYRNISKNYYDALGDLQLALSQAPDFIYQDENGIYQMNTAVLDAYINNLNKKGSTVERLQIELAESLKEAELNQQALLDYHKELQQLAIAQAEGFQLGIEIVGGEYRLLGSKVGEEVKKSAESLLKFLKEKAEQIEKEGFGKRQLSQNKYLNITKTSRTNKGTYADEFLRLKKELIEAITKQLQKQNEKLNLTDQRQKDTLEKQATKMTDKLISSSVQKFSSQIIDKEQALQELAPQYITSSLGTNVSSRQGYTAELTHLGFNNKQANQLFQQLEQCKAEFEQGAIEEAINLLLRGEHTGEYKRTFNLRYEEDAVPLHGTYKANNKRENLKKWANKARNHTLSSKTRMNYFDETLKKWKNSAGKKINIEQELRQLESSVKSDLYKDLSTVSDSKGNDKIDSFFQVLDKAHVDAKGNDYYIAISNKRRNSMGLSSIDIVSNSDLFHSLDLLTQNGTEDMGDLLFIMLNQSTASIYRDESEQEAIKKYVEDMTLTKFLNLSFNPGNFIHNAISQDVVEKNNNKVLYVMQTNQTYIPAYTIMTGLIKQFSNNKTIIDDIVTAQIQFDNAHSGVQLWLASFALVGSREQSERWSWVANQVAANTKINVELNTEALLQFFSLK